MNIGIIFLKNSIRSTTGFIYTKDSQLIYSFSNRQIKDIEFPRNKRTNKYLKDVIAQLIFKKFNSLSFNSLILFYEGFNPVTLKKILKSTLSKEIYLINLVAFQPVAFNGTKPKKYKKKFKKQLFPYHLYLNASKIEKDESTSDSEE